MPSCPLSWDDALVPTPGRPSRVYWSLARAGENPGLQAEGPARPAGCGSFAPRSASLSLSKPQPLPGKLPVSGEGGIWGKGGET